MALRQTTPQRHCEEDRYFFDHRYFLPMTGMAPWLPPLASTMLSP